MKSSNMPLQKTACHLIALLAAISLVSPLFALSGCTQPSTTSNTQNSSLVTTQTSQNVQVTDSVGRTVDVPANCSRIAALDSFSGEALVMAGAGPLMVAAPNGVKSDVVLKQIYPDIDNVAVPISGGAISIESLSALSPDVVLVKTSLYYSKGEVGKLEKLGIPYIVIGYATIEEQIEALETIQKILPSNQADTMGKIVATYQDGVSRVDQCAARVPDSEKVRVYHAINQAVVTDGASSIGADWIARTGAIDVSAEEASTGDSGDYQATLEQVFVWDPDMVICNEATTADYLLSDSKWTGLRAVENRQVYPIPIGATRWGQRGSVETWFAMIWLGKLAYPDYFDDISLHAEVVEFYNSVLGVQIDDVIYDKMMTGKDMRKQATGDGKQP